MSYIFKRNTLNEKLDYFETPKIKEKIKIVNKWVKASTDGSLQSKTETQCEQAFNNDFFVKILGYTPFPNIPYTIEPKAKTEIGAQKPDAILGYFDSEIKRVTAVVEIKDANTPLDNPQRRHGNLTPIQQAFKYKPQYKKCKFVIATNFVEIRLFQENELDYEKFTLKSISNPGDNYRELKKFIFLLSANNFVIDKGKSNTEELLSEIRVEQEDISEKFYEEYSHLRHGLMRDIWENNKSKRDIHFIAMKAQKILDRVVFVSFCEDRSLLPEHTLHKLFKNAENSYLSTWDMLKGFFNAIDKGSVRLDIPEGYNGGLFQEDTELNSLDISGYVLENISKLARYDFEDDLTVNILGHIFEQSISDLEEIKRKASPDKIIAKSKRKEEGIYYTPDFVVDYIVKNSLGKYLEKKQKEIFKKYKLHKNIQDKVYTKREKKALMAYQEFLKKIRVLDPACGSGAFLVKAFDYLLDENRRIGEMIGGLDDLDIAHKEILNNNIFGVDLNEESIEITKLSLWLNTALKRKKLSFLDKNLKCGNSLIDDIKFAGKSAFRWKEEFDEILKDGGFDVVLGNPPYVSNKRMHKIGMQAEIEYWSKKYESSKSGNYDLYVLFIEQGLKLVKQNGYLSYIVPNKLLVSNYSRHLLEHISELYCFEIVSDFSDIDVFKDASVYPIVILLRNTKCNSKVVRRIVFERDISLSVKKEEKWNYIKRKPHFSKTSTRGKIIHKMEGVTTCNEFLDFQPGINGFQFKNYGTCITDGKSSSEARRVVITGNIDPYILLDKPTKYRGNTYLDPYISYDPKVISENKWKLFISPKIMVAGMTKRIEAILDAEGQLAPSVNVYNILSSKKDLREIIAILNSKLINWYFKNRFKDKHLAGGYISVNNKLLKQLPFIDSDSKELRKLADKLIKNKAKYHKLLLNNLNLLKSEYRVKPTKKLKKFYILKWDSFIEEIDKQNSTLDINEKESLQSWFKEKKQQLLKGVLEATETEQKIDTLTYKLYGIDDTEIKIIEKKS